MDKEGNALTSSPRDNIDLPSCDYSNGASCSYFTNPHCGACEIAPLSAHATLRADRHPDLHPERVLARAPHYLVPRRRAVPQTTARCCSRARDARSEVRGRVTVPFIWVTALEETSTTRGPNWRMGESLFKRGPGGSATKGRMGEKTLKRRGFAARISPSIFQWMPPVWRRARNGFDAGAMFNLLITGSISSPVLSPAARILTAPSSSTSVSGTSVITPSQYFPPVPSSTGNRSSKPSRPQARTAAIVRSVVAVGFLGVVLVLLWWLRSRRQRQLERNTLPEQYIVDAIHTVGHGKQRTVPDMPQTSQNITGSTPSVFPPDRMEGVEDGGGRQEPLAE
ncbi:hypothetical protein B0H17DRAFT_1140037 [Mycena rosella]|uniref:Uncharacterized protein n=1 Tax=Mycena rosella TaxID=1033263 RepID=A0AAD7GBS9_MYCRO|nr:hypothetical protein B0H17DRAFT_1140037 [Mycena rosella]